MLRVASYRLSIWSRFANHRKTIATLPEMHKQPAVVFGVDVNSFVLCFDVFAVEKFLDPLHELAAALPGNNLS